MTDINATFERMIAEMQRYGATPAPSNGGSYNNLLRYREAREKILDRFLDAFAEGYRLGKEDARRGKWIFEPGKIPRCSECGEYSDDGDKGAAICPWCGVRMDKEAVDGE